MTHRIAFVGAPGVGKSTLTEKVQHQLEARGMRVGYAPEYAREFIDRFGFPEHGGLQYHILKQQRDMERQASLGNQMMLTDTAVFFSYIYPSIFRAEAASPQEQVIIDEIRDEALDHCAHYSLVFYLPLREEIVDDGIRVPRDTPMIDNVMREFLGRHSRHFPGLVELPEGNATDQLPHVMRHIDAL